MAKPTSTFLWAQDELYSSGPFVGAKTKLIDAFGASQGAIPGEGIVAQFYNSNMATIGSWTGWLFDGSSAAGLVAHIVETDADGEAALGSLVLGGTASVANPLTITDNSTTTALINASNTGTGFGILVSVTGDLAAIRATGQSSTGSVIEALNLSGTGIGVKSQVSTGGTAIKAIATTGVAIDSTATTGLAFLGNSNSPGLPTTSATNSSVTGVGVFGSASHLTATSDAKGVYGLGANGAVGVYGESEQGDGVFGISGGDTSAAGVHGESILGYGVYGTGYTGVRAIGSTGYGLSASSGSSSGIKTSSASYYALEVNTAHNTTAPLHIKALGTPSSIDEGDLYFQATNKNFFFAVKPSGGGAAKAMAAWGTPAGFTEGFNEEFSGVIPAGTQETLLTVTLKSPFEPRIVGYVEISFGFYGYSDGTLGTNSDQIVPSVFDETAGVTAGFSGLRVVFNKDVTSYPPLLIAHQYRYLLPDVGERTFGLRCVAGLNDLVFTDARMSIRGVYTQEVTP